MPEPGPDAAVTDACRIVDVPAATRFTGEMRGWVRMLVAAAAVAGCGPTMNIGARFPSSRLVAMPAIGATFAFGLDGEFTPRNALGAQAAQSMDDSINYRLRAHGARAFTWDVIEKLPNARDFVEWSARSMQEIMLEYLGKSNYTHGNVSEFRYPQDLGTWRRSLAGDYLLIAYFINGYDTPERAGSWTTSERAARRALACVVDLSDGRMAWCRFTDAQTDNMASRDDAQEVVDRLLDKMLTRSDRIAPRP